MNNDHSHDEPRRPGPKPFDSKLVFNAADEIWQGGKGPIPELKAVLARVKGATQKICDALQDWNVRNLGFSSAPPIPTSVAKALNEHFQALQKEEAVAWQSKLEASRNDVRTLNECLAEQSEEVEALKLENDHALRSRDQQIGEARQLALELERSREVHVLDQAQLAIEKVASVEARTELECSQRQLMATAADLAEERRQRRDAHDELAKVQADLAATRAILDAKCAEWSDERRL